MFIQVVCLSTGGHAWQVGLAWQGGVHGGGLAWQGECMAGGMHGRVHAWQGACVVVGGMHGSGGHVWQSGHGWQILRDTVNERAVRILLECILVLIRYFESFSSFFRTGLLGQIGPSQNARHTCKAHVAPRYIQIHLKELLPLLGQNSKKYCNVSVKESELMLLADKLYLHLLKMKGKNILTQ